MKSSGLMEVFWEWWASPRRSPQLPLKKAPGLFLLVLFFLLVGFLLLRFVFVFFPAFISHGIPPSCLRWTDCPSKVLPTTCTCGREYFLRSRAEAQFTTQRSNLEEVSLCMLQPETWSHEEPTNSSDTRNGGGEVGGRMYRSTI